MLHDLFLYDWHTHAKKTGDRFHGLTHPKTALKNASKFFELNEIEKDIIYNHMWPVTFFRIPKTKEGFITTLTDKYSALFICYDEEKYADEVKENEKTTSKKCSTNRKCK